VVGTSWFFTAGGLKHHPTGRTETKDALICLNGNKKYFQTEVLEHGARNQRE
jgi:hypothetical protein